MASERQIQANRANALKSTGPKTPEGKRNSSKNAALPGLLSSTVVLKGESKRRYNDLAAALILQFQPRNSAEAFLIQTMTVARWRLLRSWGIQTAAFEIEMAKTREKSGDAAGSGAVLAAITLRGLTETPDVIALPHRLEVSYSRQYNQALALLLKLRGTPDPAGDAALQPPLELSTETWDDNFSIEANFESQDSTGIPNKSNEL